MTRFLFLSALFVFKASAQSCGPDSIPEAECLARASGVDEQCCMWQEGACFGATAANGLAQFCPTPEPTLPPTTPDPTTRPPTTASPTTPAPTTASPTTPAPTSAAPTTAAPTTPAPTTPAPTTPAPTTPAPTTPAPTTAPPTTTATTTTTTAPPTTRPPTTRPPTTRPPTTRPPTTAPPTTTTTTTTTEMPTPPPTTRPPTTPKPTTAPPTTTTTTTTPPPTLAPTCICDDLIGNFCWCKTETCPTSRRRLKGKKKSKGKKKKKKGSSVPGCGDCDCDKSVGMTYMEVVNKGTQTVNIDYYDKSGSSRICGTTGIQRGDVSECDASHFGGGDFETNTVVKVTPTGGGSGCTTEIHTSCSSTIIGTIGSQNCGIEVTKWADQNLCTNGFTVCGVCDKVETTKFTDVQNTVGEKCYCPSAVGLSSRRRLKGKKSSQASLGVSSSALGCECDKSTGMLVMRLRWSGPTAASSITLTGQKTGAFFCSFTNVAIGEEIECYASENGNSDYETNTDVVVTGATSCSGSVHTSCSKDIVGWTAEGCEYLLVTGWADGDGDCDDGFEECPCDAFTNAFRLSAAHDMVYKSVFALVMVAFVTMMV